jgi:trk system potassium uptake protein TrkA
VNAVVIGCGDTGARLAELLAAGGHNVVVVDRKPEALRALGAGFNGATVTGIGYDEDVLRRAGIETADALASVTENDNVNIFAAEVATRIFHVPRVVARLTDPALERTLQQLGLDYVCGTTIIAQALADRMTEGHAHAFTVRGDVEIMEFLAGPEIEGRRVVEVQIPGEFLVSLLTRGAASLIPRPETVLHAGDRVVAVVQASARAKVRRFMASPRGAETYPPAGAERPG